MRSCSITHSWQIIVSSYLKRKTKFVNVLSILGFYDVILDLKINVAVIKGYFSMLLQVVKSSNSPLISWVLIHKTKYFDLGDGYWNLRLIPIFRVFLVSVMLSINYSYSDNKALSIIWSLLYGLKITRAFYKDNFQKYI